MAFHLTKLALLFMMNMQFNSVIQSTLNELAKLRYPLTTDGHGNQQSSRLYCFDWQLPYKSIARIVMEYGRKQPAHRLAVHALQTVFPCR